MRGLLSRRSAGFQPAVSPTSSRQGVDSSGRREKQEMLRGLEARDTADWKSALRLGRALSAINPYSSLNYVPFLTVHHLVPEHRWPG